MMRRVDDIAIRQFEGYSEYEASVQLQIDVWGFSEREVVPAAHLVAMDHYGGICLGAFDATKMVGFACGFAGWLRGRPFHHSHMLAVVPEYRGRRLGEKLKWAQRERVLEQGLDLINWTFDPLQAPNANLNINRLGCVVRKYKVNLYGVSESPLHGSIPTDRFEAAWHLKGERVLHALSGEPDTWPSWESLPRANRTERTAAGLLRCAAIDLTLEGDALLIEIPRTVTDLMARDRDLALDWRLRTRDLFVSYFEKGYRVEGVHRSDEGVFYRLVAEPSMED